MSVTLHQIDEGVEHLRCERYWTSVAEHAPFPHVENERSEMIGVHVSALVGVAVGGNGADSSDAPPAVSVPYSPGCCLHSEPPKEVWRKLGTHPKDFSGLRVIS